MSNRKFKKGDIIKCIKELIDYSQIGDIPPKNKPVLGQDYEVLEDCLRYSVKLNINRAYYHPLEAFELVNDDKLSLVIAKLKEDLLDKNLTIKTNNEQRIMLKAICQELDIAHYTLVYSQYNNTVDIDNTYIVFLNRYH